MESILDSKNINKNIANMIGQEVKLPVFQETFGHKEINDFRLDKY